MDCLEFVGELFVEVVVILCNDMPSLKVIILGYVVLVGDAKPLYDDASLCLLHSHFDCYSCDVLCLCLRNLVRMHFVCCCCHVARDSLCSSYRSGLRENYLKI